MWRSHFFLTFALIAAVSLSGCASLFNFHGDRLKIETNPKGAAITIGDNLATCISPCAIELPPKSPYTITAHLEGYETYKGKVTRRPSAWFWVNLVGTVYGLGGMAIDWATGRMWTWSNQRMIVLKEGEDPEDEGEDEEETPPPTPIPPPPPKKEWIAPKPVEIPTAPPPAKPLPAKEQADDLHTRYPEATIIRRIEWHRGKQPADDQEAMVACIYKLLKNQSDETRISLDEVVILVLEQRETACNDGQ